MTKRASELAKNTAFNDLFSSSKTGFNVAAMADGDKIKKDFRTYAIHPSAIRIIDGFNSRMDYGDIEELAMSLKAEHENNGQALIQPLILMSVKGEKDKYDLIAGHRRMMAAQWLWENLQYDVGGLASRIYKYDTPYHHMIGVNMRENDQKPLTPIEEAINFKRLRDADYTLEQIRDLSGRSICHISKRLTLLTGADEVVDAVAEGVLQSQMAAEIVVRRKDDLEGQRELVEKAKSGKEGKRAVRETLKAEMNASGRKKRAKKVSTGTAKPEPANKRLTQKEHDELVKSHSVWVADFVKAYGVKVQHDEVMKKAAEFRKEGDAGYRKLTKMLIEFGKIDGVGLVLGIDL
ncbi:ParB-like partition protein [Vibrio phage vB_VpaS_MAR10]|uniref:Putative parB-like partitioning protein n=1 Tax=Vibrio phage vB_VpaS_MAR10 TaxID=1229755 RepID=K7R6J8_9CAUD|nr:ParB-like partition protein [Vibrio phage vB_VpaS_MAR10]AFV81321.1 putative parB-like partitioning protein [Vibrio phage vB_VpaS_MAR10]AXH68389.1 ParB [Vibrio phage R01]